ncbi:hypothetical protein CDAR_384451 [Caerostris darwini]|uniref:Uncharacterized protein n=1 Tax=Caerostris darwini TaxID=1538125 RepID=A0AAV4RNK1_9ARAC|nr:hypothetical protein CDAR_384451 [Caerostris darwini]
MPSKCICDYNPFGVVKTWQHVFTVPNGACIVMFVYFLPSSTDQKVPYLHIQFIPSNMLPLEGDLTKPGWMECSTAFHPGPSSLVSLCMYCNVCLLSTRFN